MTARCQPGQRGSCTRQPANVLTLRDDGIDHMFMMNNTKVFNTLLTVI